MRPTRAIWRRPSPNSSNRCRHNDIRGHLHDQRHLVARLSALKRSKTRRSFPTDDAVLKIYLAIRTIGYHRVVTSAPLPKAGSTPSTCTPLTTTAKPQHTQLEYLTKTLALSILSTRYLILITTFCCWYKGDLVGAEIVIGKPRHHQWCLWAGHYQRYLHFASINWMNNPIISNR